ncbi:MAG: lysoplasmalogenase [Aeromicrobium sp.]|uniref:lysoplasmalogenase n=1 Tax=Aeromicrobium sp. TaxID=1871063 RepID=UPI0025BC2813|nr:lysoplasmalogenase [Aeromicrobium sp.]MCK5891477.1 lysoplasmalogenase [Aeromicrobium sp.]MDF1704718.1 lysoplasmalogenase [Aeromicrobium sp.]
MHGVRVPWWPLFGVVAVTHVVLLAGGVTPWDSITKCLAAPLLIGWVLTSGAPRILALALAFCLGGDAFLEIDGMFLAGMASFALAHVCFISWFVRHDALSRLRARPAVAIGLVGAAAILVALVWGGIDDPVVRAVLPLYALLLSGTAATAIVTERLAGLGAVLFLVSDALIALTEFDRLATTAASQVAIMVLYLAAIALLTAGGARLAQAPAPTPAPAS